MKRKQTILRSVAIGLLAIGMMSLTDRCHEVEDPSPWEDTSISTSEYYDDDDDTTDTPTEETPTTVEITVNGTIVDWDDGNMTGQLQLTEDSAGVPAAGDSMRALISALQSKSAKADKTGWETGDQIGISGGGGINVCYEYQNGGFAPATGVAPISVVPGTLLTAYYPYQTEASPSVSLPGNDNNISQYLYASSAAVDASGNVSFEFEHCMSRIDVTVSELTDEGAQVSIKGFAEGSFSLTSGTIELKPITETNIMEQNVQLGSNTATFYLLPQTLTDQFTVTVNSNDLTNSSLLLQQNYYYTLEFIMAK